MAKDEGYYSFEHNPYVRKGKCDAATQTSSQEKDIGLFKGSTSQLMEATQRISPAERPKTLRKLKNVYENVTNDVRYEDGNTKGATSATDKSLSILSPFDEQEEWAKISEIMASFSTGLVRDSIFVAEMEREIQARLGLTPHKKVEESPKVTSKIGQWLQTMGLENYEAVLLENGYDEVDFLNGILDEEELKNIGISEKDVEVMMKEIAILPSKISEIQKRYPRTGGKNNNNNVNNNANNNNNDQTEEDETGFEERQTDKGPSLVESWLDSIRLGIYKDTFKRHLYLDMERVKRIWEVELTAVLEISKSGHRRRILASVNSPQKGGAGSEPNIDEINADLSELKCNIQQLKEEIREKLPAAINSPTAPPQSNLTLTPNAPNTGTLRHSHKKNRPAPPPPAASVNGTPGKTVATPDLEIRNPSELLVGVPSTLTTQWRHRPEELVSGNITYVANYLGSTLVKELKGTESTKKSIQKLKKTTNRELTSTPDITLAISYRGVKFLNTGTQSLVCEHEIRNIHCACQDADDLTHFAYITKDHISRSHYCHVFCVETMDQATEVILTLGQAFEVAYQMALREQFTSNRIHGNGHTRSQSANQIIPNIITTNNNHHQQSNHSRSLSVNEMKVNDNMKIVPLDHANSTAIGEGDKIVDPTNAGKAPIVANDDL